MSIPIVDGMEVEILHQLVVYPVLSSYHEIIYSVS